MVTQYDELTDSQWEVIKEYLPVQRKRKYCLRVIVNAIFWILRTGGNLESRFPAWQLVYYYYWKWEREGVWNRLNAKLNEWARQEKAVSPTLVCVDSQSVKTGPFIKADKGWDGNKKINGRKRHLLVDSLGLIREVLITGANEYDGIYC